MTDYSMSEPLSVDDASTIYQDMAHLLINPDNDCLFLWEDVVRACAHYTKLRAEWQVTDLKTKGTIGHARTSAHNVVINSFVAFRRLAKSRNLNTQWGDDIGLSHPDTNRKRIGDFANYLTYITALKGR